MPRSRSTRNVVLWLAILLLQIVCAINPEQLKVRLNEGLLESSGNIVFGTVLEIENLSTWKEEHIVHLALKAHEARSNEFDKQATQKKIGKVKGKVFKSHLPTVTTTLVVDNVAYVSSSMKGPAFLYNMRHETPPHWHATDLLSDKCKGIVSDGLLHCQAKARPQTPSKGTAVGHRTGASCGEVFALLNFCRSGVQPKKELSTANTKIVAIRDAQDDKGKTYAEIAKPCGPDEKSFGCNRLLRYDGINVKEVIQPSAKSENRDLSDDEFFVFQAVI